MQPGTTATGTPIAGSHGGHPSQNTPQASGMLVPARMASSGKQDLRNGLIPGLDGQGSAHSRQKAAVARPEVPLSARNNSSTGQKSQISGQSLLSRVQAIKRNRQTTLDSELKPGPSPCSHSPESAERASKSARRQSRLGTEQTPAANGQDLASGKKAFTETASRPHAEQHRSEESTYGGVAQVLDLTQDPGAGTSVELDQQGANDILQPGSAITASSRKRRRHFLLQGAVSGRDNEASGPVVDLT